MALKNTIGMQTNKQEVKEVEKIKSKCIRGIKHTWKLQLHGASTLIFRPCGSVSHQEGLFLITFFPQPSDRPSLNLVLCSGPEKVKVIGMILTTLPTKSRLVYKTLVLTPNAHHLYYMGRTLYLLDS